MKKRDLKDYNRLLRDRNEVLEDLMQLVNDGLSDACRCELLQEENDELVSARDWNNAQDELISKIADTAMDYLDDIDDLQADWADSNVVAGTAMLAMATEISRVTEERDRFRGIIRELKREKYDMGMGLERMKKQNARLTDDLIAARKRLRAEAME